MTRKKEWLENVRFHLQRVGTLESQIAELESQAMKTTSPITANESKHTPNPQSREEVYVRLMDKKSEYAEELKECEALKDLAEYAIEKSVHNPYMKYTLKAKYLQGKSFAEIGLDINRSERQVIRIHGFALMQFEIPEQ